MQSMLTAITKSRAYFHAIKIDMSWSTDNIGSSYFTYLVHLMYIPPKHIVSINGKNFVFYIYVDILGHERIS